MARFISPITDIKPNGTVSFFDSNTNAAKLTYKDELETIPNLLAVPVNANGNLPNVWFSGSAAVIFLDEFGVQYAARNPVGEEIGIGNFTGWSAAVSYSINDITIGSNGSFYLSITDGNQNNDPSTPDPINWEEIRFIGVWNTNITYTIGDVVQTSDGILWRSLTATSGNNPSTDNGTNWALPVSISSSWVTKAIDFTAIDDESYQIDASSNTVDVTIPTLAIGDPFVFHNLITSTFKVQILNPTQTIKGINGNITATTNMEISAGQSVQIIATSTTILSIVGVLL